MSTIYAAVLIDTNDSDDDAPCRDCQHVRACMSDGHECRAFRAWVGSGMHAGNWKPEWRTRPMSPAEIAARIAADRTRRACPTDSESASPRVVAEIESPIGKHAEVAKHETAPEQQDETVPPAEARCDPRAIDSVPVGVGVREPIASPAPSRAAEKLRISTQTNIPRGTKVTSSDRVPARRSSGRPISEAQRRWEQYFLHGPGARRSR